MTDTGIMWSRHKDCVCWDLVSSRYQHSYSNYLYHINYNLLTKDAFINFLISA